MKITHLITTALIAIASATHYDQCVKKSSTLVAAIWDFCSKTDIMVPSDYALGGSTKGAAFVQIFGPCAPKQWIPQYWCRHQFYKMCAEGDEHGNKVQKFGRAQCQTWTISNVNSAGKL